MDRETRLALASIYEEIDSLLTVASEARASALALEKAISGASPELKAALAKANGAADVVEIRLQAEHTHVSLRQLIERLQTLNT